MLHQIDRGSRFEAVNGAIVTNFIRDNGGCRFGMPKRILSVSATPLINTYMRQLCEAYSVEHVKSSPYYP